MIPAKLKSGDEVRVVAPSRSLAIISQEQQEVATERFKELGLRLSFGKHVLECDDFRSSSIESRVQDLHVAFSDKNVKAIITVIGGFNSNQLLKYLDYELIARNPKIFCGYSDITALQNAIFAKTGLVTYSGPHYSTFAMKHRFDFTKNHFVRCLFDDKPLSIEPSAHWSDDAWYADQNNRDFIKNPGFITIKEGAGEGTIVGGNLCTLNLLHGTPFMPSLRGAILFLEDDEAMGSFTAVEFDRNLQSILHQPDFEGVLGIVIGRFQKKSEMTEGKLRKIIDAKIELQRIPIIYGVDFGHTDPYITFPIGGRARIRATSSGSSIEIADH